MPDDLVLQLVPAAAGWRVVNALLGYSGELEGAEDDKIIWVTPVACFALVEGTDRERRVVHVVPEDWPQYLWVGTDDHDYFMGYLGPGEEIDDDHRDAARDMIRKHNASRDNA